MALRIAVPKSNKTDVFPVNNYVLSDCHIVPSYLYILKKIFLYKLQKYLGHSDNLLQRSSPNFASNTKRV